MKAQVNNFKSLKNVEVDFGKSTILIGKNSSGKSNLLEALFLFFNQLDPAPQRDIGGVEDYLWHNRQSDNPIEFILTILLTKREYEQVFTKELSKHLSAPFIKGELKICREITFKTPNTATIRTRSLVFDNIKIIEEATIDETVLKTTATKNIADILTKLLTNISNLLKDKLRLILAVRDNPSKIPQFTERPPNILPQIQSQMITTLDSDTLTDARMWERIEKDIEEIPSLRRLEVRAGKLRNREGIFRFPIPYTGGGDQEILTLTFMLRHEKAAIFAIEEPETHLHPHLARIFFNTLKKVSQRKQVLITTHSPIFLDLANLENCWICRKENRETKVYKIEGAKDLRTVSYELGIRPSDVLLADKLLFVEGPIDKKVYGIWAEKLGYDLKSPIISVISLRGKTKGKRHLQAWSEVTKNIPVSVSMILDKDAKSEADKLVEDGLITRRQISILTKGAIEDYYDRNILIKVMQEKYGNEFTANKLKPTQSKGLMNFLKSKHKDWKVRSRAKFEIGEKVATEMSKDKIHNDIVNALEKTNEYLTLPEIS